MNGADLRAPFPWFGGKRKVAPQVWEALGDVGLYVEPFAGSLAVLLGRPPFSDDTQRLEVVNDMDGFVCNFWRALAADPEAVAFHADWPVNEIDLFSRHMWLVNQRDDLTNNLQADPDYYDAKIAGWWVWGICSWIGGGWCAGTGPWHVNDDGNVTKRDASNNNRPGVKRQLPHLGSGQGVNRPGSGDLTEYLSGLAERLRQVRVINGDWARVVTNGATSFGSTVGVFLDPPYLGEVRTSDIYAVDNHTIAHDVREWAIAAGDNPRFRIVLAGYAPEHDHIIPATWRRIRWSASAGYQTTNSAKTAGGNIENRHLETLWISPHCLNPDQGTLW